MKTKSILFVFQFIVLSAALFFAVTETNAQAFRFTTRGEPEIKTARQLGNHGFEDTITARGNYWNYIVANGGGGAAVKFKSVQALLSFHVDHAFPKKVSAPYVYRLTYVLTGYPDADTINHRTEYTDTLTIGYNPDSLSAYQDIQVKRYSNFHKVRVRLTGLYDFTNPSSIVSVPLNTIKESNFNIEATILTQPYDKHFYGSTGSTSNVLNVGVTPTSNDYLEIRWNLPGQPLNSVPNLTPVSYELEWTYADDYKASTSAPLAALNTSEIRYDFNYNSTRIWLDTNYYRIPVIYQRGYLIYRVRAVRPDSIAYQYPVYGGWSVPVSSGQLSSLTSGAQYSSLSGAHMSNQLNWQYTISFAEQGKYKHVLSYFDGLLKNRQSLTRINSNPNQVIASEQVYDYEGRPAIQLLPIPVAGTTFRYIPGMMTNTIASLPYKAADFDTIRHSSCPGEFVPAPLTANAPGNIYYSRQNTDTARFQKFVPDAGGYPFVQTILSPGHDQRVEMQGGAGDTLQIGRGHVTTNEYVSADQQDLNRLFGINAGYAGFYRKTVTTDPNGQVSMGVQDFQGRQVASALIGRGGNPQVHAITPNTVPDSSMFKEDLIANTTQQKTGNKLIADKSFYMDVKGLDTIQYIYELEPYPVCTSPGKYLSVKASYDIKMNDNCGTQVYQDGGILGITGVVTTPTLSPFPSAPAALWLEKGKHTVHKELTVNMDDIYAAVDSYMYQPGNSCIKTEQKFIREEVEATPFPCPDEDDPCAANRKRMMQELWPTRVIPVPGAIRKYGYYDIDANGNLYSNDNSIFTLMGNVELGTPYLRYQDPCTNLPSSVTWMGMTYTNLKTLPVDTFIKIFNDDIAAALLPLHPEYCRLMACFVDTFKDRVMAIPDGVTASSLNLLRVNQLIAADPLYPVLNNALGGNFHDSLAAFRGGRIFIDTAALLMAYCNCGDSTMFRQCYQRIFSSPILLGTLINNQVKNGYFKSMVPIYFANRERFKNYLLSGQNLANCQPCKKPIRMTLMQRPVFTTYFTAGGDIDTSSESSFFNLYGSSGSIDFDFLKRLAQKQSTEISEDSLVVLQDSANALHPVLLQALCATTVDSIIAQLVNCQPYGNLAGVRDTLLAICSNDMMSSGGNFTPMDVKHALLVNGITLDDLCNPYLLNYDNLAPPATAAISKNINCKPADFYTDVREFLNDTAMRALRTASITSTLYPHSTLLRSGNAFEAQIISVIGTNNATMHATFTPSSSLYTLNVYAAAGASDTVKINLRGQGSGFRGGCPNFFTPGNNFFFPPLDSFQVTGVECIRELPSQVADGLIGNYAFRLNVRRRLGLFFVETCTMLGWNDRVEMNEPPGSNKTDFSDCVPCTKMKQLYSRFREIMDEYGVEGTNHPYYATMLRSFMNSEVQLPYTAAQYDRFIESCALADSMAIRRYISYGYFAGATNNNIDAFIGYARSLHGVTIDVPLRLQDGIALINFHNIPRNKLRDIRQLLYNHGGVTDANFDINQTGDSRYLGTYLYPDGSDVNLEEIIAITNATGVEAGVTNGMEVWTGTGYQTYVTVDIMDAGHGDAAVSRGLHAIRKYIYEQGLPGFVIYNRESTIDADYYNPLKQDYLNYVYHLQHLNDQQVLDSIQSDVLIQRIPSYNDAFASYGNPMAPGDIQNLYITDPHQGNAHYTLLQRILDTVQTNPYKLFFNTGSFLSINGNLRAYRCSDGSYWYRYFGSGDTLFNVFIKPPAYLSKASLVNFHSTSVSLVPGNSDTRNFKLTITDGTTTTTLDGFTSFRLAKTDVLENAVLANPVTASIPTADTMNNCERRRLNAAVYRGQTRYRIYFDSMRNSLRQAFFAYVMDHMKEKLYLGYQDQRFNYTLYYYDRAGNLNHTVPPAGVKPLSTTVLGRVDSFRNADATPVAAVLPQHNKMTTYEYNSTNQVVRQYTPDGGNVDFFMDKLGRPIFSQNEKQRPTGRYTYTLYDEQSRIIETGQVQMGCPWFAPVFSSTSWPGNACHYSTPIEIRNPQNTDSTEFPNVIVGYNYTPHPPIVTNLFTWPEYDIKVQIRSRSREDVVWTTYDTAIVQLGARSGMSTQQNLRKRVTAIRYFDFITPNDAAGLTYNHATHYSYDIAGNVKTLTQEYPALAGVNQRFKRIDYDYDLLSGKINLLSYNRGFADQFYQKYSYDADNRITEVNSSQDGYIWQRDASYEYYKHGPLARMSLGELRVQGVDYAYTIQGWLKAINGDILSPDKDMGRDNGQGNVISTNDAVATALNYFKGDYRPIGSQAVINMDGVDKNLYNGNITNQSTAIAPFPTLKATYNYDQLNRISTANYATLNTANNTLSPTGQYRNNYKYDDDGNITRLVRFGGTGGGIGGLAAAMDSLVYFYSNAGNKLRNIIDPVLNNASFGNNDIPYFTDDDVTRYEYDAIGNLVKDEVNGQNEIKWNLYNKVTDTRNNSAANRLHFGYDGSGNRVSKIYTRELQGGSAEQSEYYVRDATGNLLAVYGRNRNYNLVPIKWLTDINVEVVRETGLHRFINSFIVPEYSNEGFFAEAMEAFVANRGATAPQPVAWYLDHFAGITPMMMASGVSYLTPMTQWGKQNNMSPVGTALRTKVENEDVSKFADDFGNILSQVPVPSIRQHALNLLDLPTVDVFETVGADYGLSTFLPDAAAWIAAIDSAAEASNRLHDVYSRILNDARAAYPEAFDTYLGVLGNDSVLLADSIEAGPVWQALVQEALITYGDSSSIHPFLRSWSGSTGLLNQAVPEFMRSTTNYYSDPGGYMEGVAATEGHGFIDTILAGDPEFDRFVYGNKANASLGLVNDIETLSQAKGVQTILKDERFYLAEHDVYGSSRLGIRSYLPLQYGSSWTYDGQTGALSAVDTGRLLIRRPWYSGDYGESIRPDSTRPWGNAQQQPYAMEHTLGVGKYEISNHLGNVLGVLSDKRVERDVDNNDTVETFRAGIRAAYDYYPFGMLMPGRYVSDTEGRCMTVTQTMLMPKTISSPISWEELMAKYGGTVTKLPGTKVRIFGAMSGAGMGQTIPLTEPAPGNVSFYADLVEGGTWRASVSELRDGELFELGSVNVTGSGLYNIPYNPAKDEITVDVVLNSSGNSTIELSTFNSTKTVLEELNVVRVLCDDKKDEYRFGFNGQQKTNEIAGVGNHNTALFWEYDTRLGKRWNIDPEGNEWESPYACFGNNPILNSDVNGDSWRDGIMGGLIGAATNLIPGGAFTNWRDQYTPDDPEDYNNALRNSDITAMFLGVSSMNTGAGMMGTGGTLTMTVVGAEVGVPVAAAGAVVTAFGASTTLNGAANIAQGYNRGKKVGETQIEKPTADKVQNRQAESQSTPSNSVGNSSGGGGSCFIAGTLVAVKDGFKKIELIHDGDSVWAFDIQTGKPKLEQVAKAFTKHTDHLVRLTINGVDIWATPEHPFYINKGEWIDAGDLQVGDLIWSKGGKEKVKVAHTLHIDSSVTVYNMYLANTHTYWVSVIKAVVHNSGPTGNTGGSVKLRNKPDENGIPNSSKIQSRDANGKTTKYTTYDENGRIVKEYRGEGKDHGNIPRPNVKQPKFNTNPKTGEKHQNGYEVRPANSNEIPQNH